MFLGNVYVFKLNEKAKIGDIIGQVCKYKVLIKSTFSHLHHHYSQVKAVDADQAENGQISYTIKNATEDLPVSINQETGQLTLTSLETNKRK